MSRKRERERVCNLFPPKPLSSSSLTLAISLCVWTMRCTWSFLWLERDSEENLLTSAHHSSQALFDWQLFLTQVVHVLVPVYLWTVFQCVLEQRSAASLCNVADAWKLSNWLDAAICPDTSSTLMQFVHASVCACSHYVCLQCVCVHQDQFVSVSFYWHIRSDFLWNFVKQLVSHYSKGLLHSNEQM